MKCDICDEEFDTDNQLMQHKAQMHAGQKDRSEQPEQQQNSLKDEELEEPDFPRAANE